MNKVTITLTDDQFDELQELVDIAWNAEGAKVPGMILGQLWDNRVVFMFIPNDKALEMQRLGIDEKVTPGDVRRQGYENENAN